MFKSIFPKEKLSESPLHHLLTAPELMLSSTANEIPIEIVLRGSTNYHRIFSNSVPLEISRHSAAACEAIERLEPNQAWISLSNVLPYVEDYRGIIASAYEKVRFGGWLIITTPHQFLFERKLQLPSRRKSGVFRFYTPARLLIEIEEALDPNSYRIRFLADDDTGFDYSVPLSELPAGNASIVVTLQKIERPSWADELESEDQPIKTSHKPNRFSDVDPTTISPLHVVAPQQGDIERILLIKLDHRGDFILADSAFKLLRQYYPKAHITLVCGAWNVAHANKSGLFDEVVAFSFFLEDSSAGAVAESEDERIRNFNKLFGPRRFDLCIDLRTFEDTRPLSKGVDARHKAGFDRRSEFPWLDIPFNLPMPTREGRAEQGFISAAEFQTAAGVHKSFEIRFENSFRPGADRCLIWGPYQDLGAGTYKLEIIIEPLDQDFEVCYDICSAQGTARHSGGVLAVRRGSYPVINASFPDPIEALEFRLYTISGKSVPTCRFMGIRFRREGEIIGQHQSEAMCLLIHLIATRLQYAYELEVLS